MLSYQLRNKIRQTIYEFTEDPEGTTELQILGWLEIAHSANYMEGAYKLNKLLEEKRDEQGTT